MSSRRRPFGVRLYLAVAFAAVAMLTAGLAFLLARETGEPEAERELTDLAVGRTAGVAEAIGSRPRGATRATFAGTTDPGFAAWAFDADARLLTPRVSEGIRLSELQGARRAVRQSLFGSRVVEDRPGGATLVSVPVLRGGRIVGAVLARASRSPEVAQALRATEEAREDRFTALGAAIVVALLLSFLIASAITSRVKRLAESAARISEGRLDEPLQGTGGRDEITDLGRALETMRGALRSTFGALREERDRLSAILEALSDAVMVVQADGEVRFANAASHGLIDPDGRASEALLPWIRRAARRGASEQDALRVGERVYSMSARELPAEGAVLIVVRDRTDELRREVAEREFVSNAAHELRNPIAGISGAIEVLRAGAKDDPDAREHFLGRLENDADRIRRLTASLLSLARMEAVGEGGSEAFDVAIVIEETVQALRPPDGIELVVDVEHELVAQGDPVLLRQVLVVLLTNAFKHIEPPGTVTVSACREAAHAAAVPEERRAGVRIEVIDTGVGIAPEEIPRIFERFYRGAGSLEREGFGLGLSIARRMVDVMGGEIGVESQPGQGSTFWVRLRAARPAPTPVA